MDATTNEGPRGSDPRRIRIGDAEREQVLSALQEHMAAGRLTVDEYEQRTEQVVAARYADDLAQVLTDLPPTAAEQERRRSTRGPKWPKWQQWQQWQGRRGRLPLPVPLLIGLAVLAIIALPGPPFFLFPLLWIGAFFAFSRHHRGRGGRGGWGGCAPRDRETIV